MPERNTYGVPRPERHFAPGPGSLYLPQAQPVRRFTNNSPAGNASQIISSTHPLAISGSYSVACYMRYHGSGSDYFAWWNNAFNIGTRLLFSATGLRFIQNTGSIDITATLPYKPGDWLILGFSKTAGTTTPRAHMYNNGTWTHVDFGVTAPDPIASNQDAIFFSSAIIATTNSDRALDAVWNGTALSDANFESLTTNLRTSDWAALNPTALWQWNQLDPTLTVQDLAGDTELRGINPGYPGNFVVWDGPAWTFDMAEEFPPSLVVSPGAYR